MQKLVLDKVDTIITAGQLLEIEAGSLPELNGVMWRWYGETHPVVGFRHRDTGEEGVIAARSIIGFSPTEIAHEPPSPFHT